MDNIVSNVSSNKATLLDVRTDEEWEDEHAVGAIHIPLNELNSDTKSKLKLNIPIYIYCGSGKRASGAKSILDSYGFSSSNIGGLKDWKQAGGKTE